MATSAFVRTMKGKGEVWYNGVFFWLLLGALFIGLSIFFMRESQPESAIDTHHHHHKSKDDDVFFGVVIGVSVITWLAIMGVAFTMRDLPWITTPTPPKLVVAVACVLAMVIPIGCSEYILTDIFKLNTFSFLSSLSYTFFLTCIQASLMPAYDYQFFHCSLGISGSIFAYLCRSSTLRILWYFLATIVAIIIVFIHHVIVAPLVDDD